MEQQMEDSSVPLLLSQTDDDREKNIKQERYFDLALGKIMEDSLSEFGFSQLFQTLLVGFAFFFDAQQIFITVFTDVYPTSWHCLDSNICHPTVTNICELPRSSWNWDDGSQDRSIISDFGLECSTSLIRSLPTSAFYAGSLVGGLLLSIIPDTFLGRKKLLFLSTLSPSLIGIAIVMSTNVWIYSLFKFLIGFARSLLGTYVIVLISERVSTKWRPRVGMIPFTFFVFGFMSLSGIAYLSRYSSWRVMYLCISIPGAIYCVFLYIFALESPRWLYLRGKRDEAIYVIKKISKTHQTDLESLFNRLPVKQEADQEQGPRYSNKDLFLRRWAFRRIIAVMILAFGIGISYYGIPLAVRDMDINIYISEAVNAMVELPSLIVSPILLEKFNRRSSLLTSCLLGGITAISCSVLTIFDVTSVAFGFELLCYFWARMGINLMMVYLVEMFPTSVRNSAVTMTREALLFGGVCGPMIVSFGQNIRWLSFAVFGFGLSVFGLFVLVLPETKGSSLCDTMEEQEQSENKNIPI